MSGRGVIVFNEQLVILDANDTAREFFSQQQAVIDTGTLRDLFSCYGVSLPFSPEQLALRSSGVDFSLTLSGHAVGAVKLICAVELLGSLLAMNRQYVFLFTVEKLSQCSDSNAGKFLPEIIREQVVNLANVYSKEQFKCLLTQLMPCLPGKVALKSADDFSYCVNNRAGQEVFGLNSMNELAKLDDYQIERTVMKKNWSNGFADMLREMDIKVLSENKPIIAFSEPAYLGVNGRVVCHSLTKVPLYTNNSQPIGIFTLAIDRNHLKNIPELRTLYFSLYKNKNQAQQKFYDHIGLSDYHHRQNPHQPHCNITPREFDTFSQIAEGKTTKQIAKTLERSPKTVEKHIESLKNKLQVDDKGALAGVYLKLLKNLQ